MTLQGVLSRAWVLLLQVLWAPSAVYCSAVPDLPVLLGMYAGGSLQTRISEIVAADYWLRSQGAAGVTFAGDFIDFSLNPADSIAGMEQAWSRGFIPFVNLMPPQHHAACGRPEAIAAGYCDSVLRELATHFKAWAQGGQKRAFLAPLPEMNGAWVWYHTSGPAFREAFLRIRTVFEQAGVARSWVRWVFAPNGWHDPHAPYQAFENYYPGHAAADIVAISAYNFGGCPADAPWRVWDTYESAIHPYLNRMAALAPGKPIFLAQTGSVDVPDDPARAATVENRSQWIRDTFEKLALYPGLRGLIYFNVKKSEGFPYCPETDYRFFWPETNTGEPGLLAAMKDPRYGKWTHDNMIWGNVVFTDPPVTFADVLPSHPFSGLPNVWYYADVMTMYRAGITSGCATHPLRYCPHQPITRAQIAIFLVRAMRGPAYVPPPPSGRFLDARGHWAEGFIEQLASDGVTAGCTPNLFCPDAPATRAQLAVLLERARHGASWAPPPATGKVFHDVTATHWAAGWIEHLAAEKLTSGCAPRFYCPEQPLTRAEMAAFLARAFSLQ